LRKFRDLWATTKAFCDRVDIWLPCLQALG
jgi:hypothetical protein